jgi:hypothetical protein
MLALSSLLTGCGRLEEHVRHADEAYRGARYGDAEEWLERVEMDVGELPIATQSRFYFVRGMSAYRLGHRDEALYYLNIGKQTALHAHGALPEADAEVLTRTLLELTPPDASFRALAAPEESSTVASPE